MQALITAAHPKSDIDGTIEPSHRYQDVAMVATWLSIRASRSVHTQLIYSYAAFRFLSWLQHFHPFTSLPQVRVDHLAAYQQFLDAPITATSAEINQLRDQLNRHYQELTALVPPVPIIEIPRHRPFRLSPVTPTTQTIATGDSNIPVSCITVTPSPSRSSTATDLRAIRAMFRWLASAEYIERDPATLALPMRQKRKKQTIETFIPEKLFSALLEFTENMPVLRAKTANEERARIRWILALGQILGLRVSEMCLNSWSAISFIQTSTDGYWRALIRGKGTDKQDADDTQAITIPNALIPYMREYRAALGLPPVPHESETDIPLCMTLIKTQYVQRTPIKARTQLKVRSAQHIITTTMRNAIPWITEHYPDLTESAQQVLPKVSAHWLRHTCCTHMLANGVELALAQEQMRHRDINTTMLYTHREREQKARLLDNAFKSK